VFGTPVCSKNDWGLGVGRRGRAGHANLAARSGERLRYLPLGRLSTTKGTGVQLRTDEPNIGGGTISTKNLRSELKKRSGDR
jgi:hypothetical protein